MKISTFKLTVVPFILMILMGSQLYWNILNKANAENFSIEHKLPSLAPMLEKVIPSVVSISIEGNTIVHNVPKLSNQFNLFFRDYLYICQKHSPFLDIPFCQYLFSKKSPHSGKFHALGSGIIIDNYKGYVATNSHVINHASNIQVQLSDGRKYQATIVGKDIHSDIALIQLKNANNLTAIKIANSDTLKVGDYTVAIGNPYGLGESVTSGIVSALGRNGLNIEHYENFIQTDAAINKGNSGGALVNLKGELIGMNTAILAPDGGNIGIGFAIPSNMVRNITQQIVNFGQVRRGELGIVGTELNSELAKIMKFNTQKGAFISQVLPHSTADKAGIHSGDIIVLLNNKPIYSFLSLRAEISSIPINTKITLGLLRDEKFKKVILTLQNSLKEKIDSSSIDIAIEGAKLSNYDNNGCKGVVVVDIKPNTSAFGLGFRKNDIILSVNKISVHNIEKLRRLLKLKSSMLVFSVKRGNSIIYLLLE